MFGEGWHCSEVVFLLGIQAWAKEVDPRLVRLGSGFGGGIGDRGDVCGAISGGVMALGLLHGRTDLGGGHCAAEAMSREYRDRFVDVNGFVNCREHTGGVFDRTTRRSCTRVVMRAVDALLDILEENAHVASPWRRETIRPFERAKKGDAS